MSRQPSEQFDMAQTISTPQNSPKRISALRAVQSPHTPPRRLRPSGNSGPGPIRRHPILRSQIPVRASPMQTTPAQHRSAYALTTLRMLNGQCRVNGTQNQNQHQTQHQTQTQPHTQHAVQSVEKAFGIYGERVHADLSEVRAVCTALVAQELAERQRLHSMCIRIMRERDAARQRVHALLREQQRRRARSVSPLSESSEPGGVKGKGRGEKRGREEADRCDVLSRNASEASFRASSSPQTRPVRSLKKSPIPGPSPPPGSPEILYLPPLYSPPPPPSSSIYSSPSSSSASNSSSGSTSLRSFPGSLSCTSSSVSTGHQHTTVKRRKSCDSTHSTSSSSSSYTAVDDNENENDIGESKLHAHAAAHAGSSASASASADLPPAHSLLMRAADAGPLTGSGAGRTGLGPGSFVQTGTFPHVDIMYMSVDGGLVCRACLLDASKAASTVTIQPSTPSSSASSSTSSPPPKPTTTPPPTSATKFPKTASWDELRDHVVFAHPVECADVSRLHPAEIFELRRRLSLTLGV